MTIWKYFPAGDYSATTVGRRKMDVADIEVGLSGTRAHLWGLTQYYFNLNAFLSTNI